MKKKINKASLKVAFVVENWKIKVSERRPSIQFKKNFNIPKLKKKPAFATSSIKNRCVSKTSFHIKIKNNPSL